jgi:hypothetical protein
MRDLFRTLSSACIIKKICFGGQVSLRLQEEKRAPTLWGLLQPSICIQTINNGRTITLCNYILTRSWLQSFRPAFSKIFSCCSHLWTNEIPYSTREEFISDWMALFTRQKFAAREKSVSELRKTSGIPWKRLPSVCTDFIQKKVEWRGLFLNELMLFHCPAASDICRVHAYMSLHCPVPWLVALYMTNSRERNWQEMYFFFSYCCMLISPVTGIVLTNLLHSTLPSLNSW